MAINFVLQLTCIKGCILDVCIEGCFRMRINEFSILQDSYVQKNLPYVFRRLRGVPERHIFSPCAWLRFQRHRKNLVLSFLVLSFPAFSILSKIEWFARAASLFCALVGVSATSKNCCLVVVLLSCRVGSPTTARDPPIANSVQIS